MEEFTFFVCWTPLPYKRTKISSPSKHAYPPKTASKLFPNVSAKLFPNTINCQLLHFLPNFTGHLSVYILLLIQFQRLVALRNQKASLFLSNSALTYMICLTLFLVFIILDEFYLFDGFFVPESIHCPLTLMFTCITNRNFKLLHKLPFDNLLYHHTQTVVYNILPCFIIGAINVAIKVTMNGRERRERLRRTIDTESSRSHRYVKWHVFLVSFSL